VYVVCRVYGRAASFVDKQATHSWPLRLRTNQGTGSLSVGDPMDRSRLAFVPLTGVSGEILLEDFSDAEASYRLFQVEPVAFPGFAPVTLSKDRKGVQAGQNLTVLSYGSADDSVRPARAAAEGNLQVQHVDDPSFWVWSEQHDRGFRNCA
jgi:hypothetical protein